MVSLKSQVSKYLAYTFRSIKLTQPADLTRSFTFVWLAKSSGHTPTPNSAGGSLAATKLPNQLPSLEALRAWFWLWQQWETTIHQFKRKQQWLNGMQQSAFQAQISHKKASTTVYKHETREQYAYRYDCLYSLSQLLLFCGIHLTTYISLFSFSVVPYDVCLIGHLPNDWASWWINKLLILYSCECSLLLSLFQMDSIQPCPDYVLQKWIMGTKPQQSCAKQ